MAPCGWCLREAPGTSPDSIHPSGSTRTGMHQRCQSVARKQMRWALLGASPRSVRGHQRFSVGKRLGSPYEAAFRDPPRVERRRFPARSGFRHRWYRLVALACTARCRVGRRPFRPAARSVPAGRSRLDAQEAADGSATTGSGGGGEAYGKRLLSWRTGASNRRRDVVEKRPAPERALRGRIRRTPTAQVFTVPALPFTLPPIVSSISLSSPRNR